MDQKTKTYVYVDAFNLYYGAIKRTKYHWLDLNKLCEIVLPLHEITRIKYFTANVKPRPNDPQEPIRQQTYLRALQTLPNLEIILGHYLSHVVRMPLAKMENGKMQWAEVIKTEEKGSDVNLATHLLHDAHLGKYDAAVVISNDSDLKEPIRIVTRELGKKVGVLNPQKQHPSQTLQGVATFFKSIRESALRNSQFPHELKTSTGMIHIPEMWK